MKGLQKKFTEQANFRDFIAKHILMKNDILGSRREINKEHLYTLDELMLILSINHQEHMRFKQLVEASEAESQTKGKK